MNNNLNKEYFIKFISADFKDKDNKDKMNKILRRKYVKFIKVWDSKLSKGYCILEENTLNLVIKRNYFNKATYEELNEALKVMKKVCIKENIDKVIIKKEIVELENFKIEELQNIIKIIFEDCINIIYL